MFVASIGRTAPTSGYPFASPEPDKPEPAAGNTALVSTTPAAERSMILYSRRPDASFVTQLIATANQIPETRTLRRGSTVDAQVAYRAVVAQDNARHVPLPGTQLSRSI
jgi:hypothetical protein